MRTLDPSIEADVPSGLGARWAFHREIGWSRRWQHLNQEHGPGFRSPREATVALGFARYVWSRSRWIEWIAMMALAAIVMWFIGEDGIEVEHAWPFIIVVPFGAALELYRARRLADRAAAYLEHESRSSPNGAQGATGADQRS